MDIALSQAEQDLLAANDVDRNAIEAARERIKRRALLFKALRRRNRNLGLVNASQDSQHPYWVRKEDLR